jgi:O-acetyl-ADP-ribose deacetylase (regulator of RNase III)
MSVTFIKGNLFKISDLNYYAHGCNCTGAMGKGIALEFKARFPKMYLEYKKLCQNKEFNLGDVFIYKEGNYIVFNLATQYSWKTRAEEDAILMSINKMIMYAETNKIQKIGLPKIGAGLGKLDWNIVKKTFLEAGDKTNVELIVIEEFVP